MRVGGWKTHEAQKVNLTGEEGPATACTIDRP